MGFTALAQGAGVLVAGVWGFEFEASMLQDVNILA